MSVRLEFLSGDSILHNGWISISCGSLKFKTFNNMAQILETTILDTFSRIKISEFQMKLHCNVFLCDQLIKAILFKAMLIRHQVITSTNNDRDVSRGMPSFYLNYSSLKMIQRTPPAASDFKLILSTDNINQILIIINHLQTKQKYKIVLKRRTRNWVLGNIRTCTYVTQYLHKLTLLRLVTPHGVVELSHHWFM